MNAAIWLPYCGAAPVPSEWMARWNFDPLLIAVLLVGGLVCYRNSASFAPERRLALAGAFLLLLLVFVSPLCALSSALFSVRVTHHLLLASIAAPLLAYALPSAKTPLPGSLGFWTGAQVAIMWAWHAPPVYEAALRSDGVYWLMQAALLGSSTLFWDRIRRSPAPSAVAALLLSMVQMGLLGALITFAPRALYSPHFLTTTAWGFSPIEDQQLAGLIMWVPAAGVYLGGALVLLWQWLGHSARATAR